MRRMARERLGITLDEIAGGHVPALHHLHELADRLESYRTDLEASEAETFPKSPEATPTRAENRRPH